MTDIKIKIEENKGYIPYDKIRQFSTPFEVATLGYYIGEQTATRLRDAVKIALESKREAKNEQTIKTVDKALKIAKEIVQKTLRKSEQFKEAEKMGHTIFYLNFNRDGIDCFISRDGE